MAFLEVVTVEAVCSNQDYQGERDVDHVDKSVDVDDSHG